MKNSLEIKHIVLAYDGSEEADHAFEYKYPISDTYTAGGVGSRVAKFFGWRRCLIRQLLTMALGFRP
jgi:hypothetical protein